MNEFIEKLIGRLEEISVSRDDSGVINGCNMGICEDDDCLKCLKKKIIYIANQLAEEYAKTPTPTHPIPIDTQRYIAELEAKVKEKEWIPCSERLPDKYGEYLCCDTFGNYILGFPSESNTSNTGFVVETENEYCYDIIAWQPLPDSYKPNNLKQLQSEAE